MMRTFFITIFFLLLINACALPPSEYENQEFVPKPEVLAASLYNDAVVLYRAGRFVDSELKFRQAAYLFPEAQNIKASLALVLRNNGLNDESLVLYRDLVAKNPKMADYKFGLAETLYRDGNFEESALYYKEAMLQYEEQSRTDLAAAAARSLSTLYFQIGRQSESLCFTYSAFDYLKDTDSTLRHVKVLTALGFDKQAEQLLEPMVQTSPPSNDPRILKSIALVKYAQNDKENASKLIQNAYDYQDGTGSNDVEILILQKLLNPQAPSTEEESSDDQTENAKAKLEEQQAQIKLFNEALTLYWPPTILQLFYQNKNAFHVPS